jgi:hypothetical protein
MVTKLKDMKKYFHPLGLLVALLVMSVSFAFYELHQSNLKYKYIIITNQVNFKTVKIDSSSNNSIYFTNERGEKVSVSGSYVIKEINRDK